MNVRTDMGFKAAIKKAINEHVPNRRALKVWSVDKHASLYDDGLEQEVWLIEVTVRKVKRPKKKQ